MQIYPLSTGGSKFQNQGVSSACIPYRGFRRKSIPAFPNR